MSYYTQLCLSWDDADRVTGSLTVDEIVEAARDFVTDHQWSEYTLTDLRKACERDKLSDPAFKNAMSFGVIDLLQAISQKFPDVTFYAKGAGEEFWDIWLREFRAGIAIREQGPFEEYADSLPPELLAQVKAAAATAAERQAKDATANWSGWLSRLLRR